jgi:hypothetical protein
MHLLFAALFTLVVALISLPRRVMDVCDAAEVIGLNDFLTAGENWTLKLFSNNVTPAETDTAGTYTEATFTGYSAKTLTRDQNAGHWSTASSVTPTGAWSAESKVAESTYAQQTWSPTTSQTIYGYFYVGSTSGTIRGAEAFSSSKNLVNGDTLNLTPRFGFS